LAPATWLLHSAQKSLPFDQPIELARGGAVHNGFTTRATTRPGAGGSPRRGTSIRDSVPEFITDNAAGRSRRKILERLQLKDDGTSEAAISNALAVLIKQQRDRSSGT
jgi:hypothetical protein